MSEHVREEQESRPGYYAILPARVRYDKRLCPMARLLYAEITALAQADGACWARTVYFCNLYGVAEGTVYRWLSALQKCGYIQAEKLTKNGMVSGRRITLIPELPPSSQKCEDDLSKMRVTSSQKCEVFNRYNNLNINNTPLPPKGESGAEEKADKLFETFWAHYPKKQDKKKARRAWLKIKGLDKLFPAIMRSLMAQCQSEQWTREGGKYIPLPTSWINGERWEDDLTGQPAQAQRPGGAPATAYEEVHRAL